LQRLEQAKPRPLIGPDFSQRDNLKAYAKQNFARLRQLDQRLPLDTKPHAGQVNFRS